MGAASSRTFATGCVRHASRRHTGRLASAVLVLMVWGIPVDGNFLMTTPNLVTVVPSRDKCQPYGRDLPS
jgi:hypothetical protein